MNGPLKEGHGQRGQFERRGRQGPEQEGLNHQTGTPPKTQKTWLEGFQSENKMTQRILLPKRKHCIYTNFEQIELGNIKTPAPHPPYLLGNGPTGPGRAGRLCRNSHKSLLFQESSQHITISEVLVSPQTHKYKLTRKRTPLLSEFPPPTRKH